MIISCSFSESLKSINNIFMLKKTFIIAAIGFFLAGLHSEAKDINIVPMPQHVEVGSGSFTLTAGTKIFAKGEGATEVANMFVEKIRKSSGFSLQQGKKAGKGTVAFVINAPSNPKRSV